MTIEIIYGANSARKARGLGVVIDVFRAFSTACYAFQAGARAIIPAKDLNEAYRLKKDNPSFVLMGEQDGRTPQGFDLGNSPLKIKKIHRDLKGKTIIHLTSCGTKGLKNAINCTERITAAFVNVSAVAQFIAKRRPAIVSLICTGTNPDSKNMDEDHLCALYLRNLLRGKKEDFKQIVSQLRTSRFASYFFDEKVTSYPKEDFYYCLDLDKFDFVLKFTPQKILKRVET